MESKYGIMPRLKLRGGFTAKITGTIFYKAGFTQKVLTVFKVIEHIYFVKDYALNKFTNSTCFLVFLMF